jgi:hypothetical protein
LLSICGHDCPEENIESGRKFGITAVESHILYCFSLWFSFCLPYGLG